MEEGIPNRALASLDACWWLPSHVEGEVHEVGAIGAYYRECFDNEAWLLGLDREFLSKEPHRASIRASADWAFGFDPFTAQPLVYFLLLFWSE